MSIARGAAAGAGRRSRAAAGAGRPRRRARGGEANLVLPDLSQVDFRGVNGRTLLMGGLGRLRARPAVRAGRRSRS